MSPAARWTARVMGALAVLFLTFDAVSHVAVIQPVVDAAGPLGIPIELMRPLGILELLLLVLYLVPRTALLGAVLWTGYLGGAVFTNLRVGLPWASHVLFPTYVGLLLWGSLWIREPRLQALFPLRTKA